jgi:hypothetical protein
LGADIGLSTAAEATAFFVLGNYSKAPESQECPILKGFVVLKNKKGFCVLDKKNFFYFKINRFFT